MQIKEGDEWKIEFITLEGSFKPMVIFFELTNSPVMFQMIINEILWDLINTGKVTRLVENNLYMKPEKSK